MNQLAPKFKSRINTSFHGYSTGNSIASQFLLGPVIPVVSGKGAEIGMMLEIN